MKKVSWKKLFTRTDGILNVITGLGSKRRDKRVNAVPIPDLVRQQEAEDFYAADATARKIVNKVPSEGVRAWIEIKNTEPELKKAFNDEFDRLKFRKSVEKAWRWARLYGGAAIFMNIDDGEDPIKPINFARARSIKTLIVLNMYELIPDGSQIDHDLDSPNFGLPTLYHVHKQNKPETHMVHYERILRFEGEEFAQNHFISNNYWHDSVLSGLKTPIINYSQANDIIGSILFDFSQRIMKVSEFTSMIAADEDDLLIKRMELQDLLRNTFKTDMIDKEDEMEVISTPLTGVKDTVQVVNDRLVGASNFPHTILLGESPKGGLANVGDSQNRDWYDFIAAQQMQVIEEPIEGLMRMLMLMKEGPTKGKIDDEVGFEFVPLQRLSTQNRAKMELDVAKKDEVYIQNGVTTPSEIALSRFGTDTFSLDTKINTEPRKEELEAEANEDPTDDEDETTPQTVESRTV